MSTEQPEWMNQPRFTAGSENISITLKPCPFCGGPAKAISSPDYPQGDPQNVTCNSSDTTCCGKQILTSYTQWNNRPEDNQ